MIRKNLFVFFIFIACMGLPWHVFSQNDSLSEKFKSAFPVLKNKEQVVDRMEAFYKQIERDNMECRLAVFPKEVNNKRLIPLLCSEGALAGSSLYALNEMWYKKYDRSSWV